MGCWRHLPRLGVEKVLLVCTGTLFGASKIPVLDASGGIAPFCDATGQFMPLLCTMNCTLAPEEARARMGPHPWQQPSLGTSAVLPRWAPAHAARQWTYRPASDAGSHTDESATSQKVFSDALEK